MLQSLQRVDAKIARAAHLGWFLAQNPPALWCHRRPQGFSCGLISFCIFYPEPQMGNKIVTEADRKFTPPLPALPGVTLRTGGRGQRVSLERGVATRSKKNPGKRSKKGG
jgi:hypothetical protein